MKLKNKILLGYSLSLALVVLVGIWGINNLRRLGKASEAILKENYNSILAAENTIDSIERQDSAILLFLLENRDRGSQQFRSNQIEFLKWLGRAEGNITISGEEEIIASIEESYQDYLTAFFQLQQQENPTTEDYYQTILPIFEQIRARCVELRIINQETMEAASENAQQISSQAIWSMAIAGATAAGIGLGFSLLLTRRIVQPLSEMTNATEKIARGEYDIALQVKSKDELGLLAREITTMSQKLKAFRDLNVGKVIVEKQRSEAIVQSIGDGIIVVDSDLKIIAINPIAANIANVKSMLATNNHFLDVFSDRTLYQHLKHTAETGKSPQLEDDILTVEREQHTQYYKFAITPVVTEAEKVIGAILLLQDVTKLKELDNLKSEFVATASHELRTPLTGMAMSLNLLAETTEDKLSESESELLDTAVEDVERLKGLVNDLLDLSKIESGKIELDFVDVEVNFLLDKAVSALNIQAEQNDVTLVIQALSEDIKTKVDANKIIWVLTNLIANALRYSDPGGEIKIGATSRNSWVEIFVVDRGAGIPLEYQGKIFDKFVQVETEKDVGGSGLGLAICKEMVQAHGGRIWVDSTVGRGSTFTFTVPKSHSESN
ncbi:HAMP domain-containing histidine kinase [Pleurocapsa sp. PCC 7319]|uniref:HAMP domain-containing histidine kinase n=1 Tax=Pleurocapsa sp. PCC 7319 TaxID=118161 RepID=UPI00034DD229|nr:HAMP domain-containing histidine kinase [Pleurocapsa sp. PCC 7319]